MKGSILCSLALTAVLAAPAAAVPSAEDFARTWLDASQKQTELVTRAVGAETKVERQRELQQSLAGAAVERAARRAAVVELSAVERAALAEVTGRERRLKVGIAKELGLPIDLSGAEQASRRGMTLRFGAARGSDDGGFVWTGIVQAPGASALRLHISGFDLPEGSELYVYNLAGQAFGPYTGRGPLGEGELYTHTVHGSELRLQLHHPAGTELPRMRVEQVGYMGDNFGPALASPRGGDKPGIVTKSHSFCSRNRECVESAACHSSSAVADAKQGVASMLFQSGSSWYICSGGLLADTDTASTVPLFITANHCIGSSGEASSLETYFDYTTTCSNPNCTQPYNNTGDTVGSAILSTSSTSDYTLLQLSSIPNSADGTEAYLGWTSTAVANSNGVNLYRISHPAGSPQAYSEHRVDTSKGTCRSWPRGNWIYSHDIFGATEGGSSGSPVVNGSGQVVGQLSGACGFNPSDSCDTSNATVDGALAAYYSNVSQWLAPSGGGGGGGGGGGECKAKGASCASGSECCSGNCKGKPGSQTCK